MKNTKNTIINLPPYSKSQKQIIFYLSSYRYLYIGQLKQLFHHKYPNRIKEWLRDLKDKGYIEVIKDEKDQTKPYIFCLEQPASHILKEDKDINPKFLKRLYKEKTYGENFINKNLFLVDCYLYFEKHKAKGSEVNFFTKQDLYGYTYFPNPMPDAYIDLKEGKTNTRYFLDIFDESKPLRRWRKRIRYYFQYLDEGDWPENTDSASFPIILIICSTEKMKRHIYYYAKSILEKSLSDDIEIFLTTKEKIQLGERSADIWQKIKAE